MSQQQEQVIFNLELNTSGATTSINKLQLVLYRALGLYNRICRLLGVPDDSPLNKMISRVQQLVMITRQLTTTVTLLQAASGPIGWALGGLGIAGVVVSSVEFMQSTGE